MTRNELHKRLYDLFLSLDQPNQTIRTALNAQSNQAWSSYAAYLYIEGVLDELDESTYAKYQAHQCNLQNILDHVTGQHDFECSFGELYKLIESNANKRLKRVYRRDSSNNVAKGDTTNG